MTEPLDDEKVLWTRIAASPRFFLEEVLGVKLDEQQIPIVEAFAASRRISVKSGHSCGKDYLSPRLGLWFWLTHQPCIVVTTGPTDRQVRRVVWGELRAAYKAAKIAIGGQLMPSDPLLKSDDPKHYMIGYTASGADSFQGFHADNVLVVVTEAQGINPQMWLGIESLMSAPNAKLMLLGNAIYEPESEFYASHSSKANLYTRFTLDSRKSSHCSKEFIAEMAETYGEGSGVYQARVEGVFPVDVADTLIPLGWIERAHERWAAHGPLPIHTPIEGASFGLDVARFGSDHTVLYQRNRKRCFIVEDRQGQDLMATCGMVSSRVHLGARANGFRIDDTGMGGGVTDRLHELEHKVIPINFGGGSTQPEKFTNTRSEMFWNLRERFRTGDIEIDPKDSKLVRDLSIIRYKMTSKGQIQLESKQEQKHRLGYSPDRADALALAALEDPLALDLESGGKSGRGLLEFMKEMAGAAKGVEAKREAVSRRSIEEIPGAADIMGGVRHGDS